MQVQVADYIDALRFEDAYTRLYETSRILITDRLVKPGTSEYKELAQMRFQAKREIMGYAPDVYKQGFSNESYDHDQSESMKAMKAMK